MAEFGLISNNTKPASNIVSSISDDERVVARTLSEKFDIFLRKRPSFPGLNEQEQILMFLQLTATEKNELSPGLLRYSIEHNKNILFNELASSNKILNQPYGVDADLPIHFAAKLGNKNAIRELTSRGVSPNTRDTVGLLAIDYALIGDCAECVDILLRSGSLVDRPESLLLSARLFYRLGGYYVNIWNKKKAYEAFITAATSADLVIRRIEREEEHARSDLLGDIFLAGLLGAAQGVTHASMPSSLNQKSINQSIALSQAYKAGGGMGMYYSTLDKLNSQSRTYSLSEHTPVVNLFESGQQPKKKGSAQYKAEMSEIFLKSNKIAAILYSSDSREQFLTLSGW